jgi:hypothetical protein
MYYRIRGVGFSQTYYRIRGGRLRTFMGGGDLNSSSQTATTMAADRYESLPLELRLAALCLPMPEVLARAA